MVARSMTVVLCLCIASNLTVTSTGQVTNHGYKTQSKRESANKGARLQGKQVTILLPRIALLQSW